MHSVKHRRKTLPWPLRLKIAVGVARGLARLHHGRWGQVVHLNISSKCILLDRDFEPKLSNFGKAMLMTNEFCEMVLVKEDVHGFGVVLLELITGMDCSRMDFSSNSILNEWIGHLLSASYFHDAMDRFLIGQGFDDEIFQLLKVACNCLDCIPDRRPTMIQVYRDIKAITERCEVVDGSEIQTQPEIRSATSQDHKQDQLFPVSVITYIFMFSLLATLTVTTATATDISCLKSIKDSVIDPYGYLNTTWDFGNNTEGFICGFLGVECWHDGENRVLNIRLSDLGLKGQFPLGLEHCTSLMSLDFSHNKFQGPIPSDISKRLPYITILDLSYNNFSGEIPSNIVNLSFLNSPRLDHNHLTGNNPTQIGQLDRIKVFSVANNQLSGPLPNFGAVIPYDSFVNNAGLCGKPLKNCSSHQQKFDYSFKGGFVIGYLVFSTSVAICFTSYCVPWVCAGERKKKITILEMMMLMRTRKHKITEDDQARSSLLEEGTKEVSTLEKRVTRMSYADLNDATDSFSENNVIGQGKVGILYKASLTNGYVLAVKKLHAFQFLEEQFISELKILGSLRHINLLPLLGFCIEQNQRFLVYEYMPNGNLYDWLHPKEGSPEKVMEWGVRVKIAIGLARGLAWIHQNCHTVRVIHLDISSKCILLDRNFQPKLSNFGEAMLMSSTCTSSVNSELWEMAFVKEDVHGFGVVLLEFITRVDPGNMTDSSNNILDVWTDHLLSSSSSYGAIDKSLIGRGFDALC
uniref:Protein kinase domain-containing protein n=1 Tax=Salix viminalis TaxID=40686 RepID=A0A6N2LYP2_SALVM